MDFTPLLLQRFWSRVKIVDDCWEWQGGIKCDGYGSFYWEKKQYPSHRVAYEIMVGDVPQGLELDHLCKNRKCCNPEHLEAVTHKQNLLRGDTIVAINSKKTHCPQGHPYFGENLLIKQGSRHCRKCHNGRT
jgi:hypothetical protein